ncbi:MAG: fused MFS/spermidine synthase [Planctomycetaceae bacterium]
MTSRKYTAPLYALTIFCSAFLLFQVQPLISKCLLPWVGGTPNVWTTCLLFFQAVLFGGYVYAHVLSRRFRPGYQALIHIGLLCVAAIWLNILPADEWKPTGDEPPVTRILLVLGATIGLPYFLLSTTGPLLQSWFARALPGRSPYRLYALSNVGSLLALLSYPFVFEPLIGMADQAAWWSRGFLLFAGLCGVCAYQVTRLASAEDDVAAPATPMDAAGAESSDAPVTAQGGRVWQWFGLAMTASVLLLATTNQVCLDVAVVPFLWVVPLGLYLLSFILCFDSDRWYHRAGFGLAGAVSMVLTTAWLMQDAGVSLVLQVLIAFGALFLACMVCHGELVRIKPGPERLTLFYLVVSAGGAAGGLFVGVIAPLLFPLYLEMHLSIAVCCVLTLGVYLHSQRLRDGATSPLLKWGAVATIAVVLVTLQSQATKLLAKSIDIRRNFYGVLRVELQEPGDPLDATYNLRYGRILHGVQFAAEERRDWPTAYFGPGSGVGRTIHALQAERPALRIGIVGLGIGTLAAYGRETDAIRFYEINPDVVTIARESFTFLSDTPSTVEIVPGDARLAMEREAPQQYDILILDAFSGDAIPTHLLTEESMKVYEKHIAPGGVLAVHISNLHFDLRPVAAALADSAGYDFSMLAFRGDSGSGQVSSLWMIATKEAPLLQTPSLREITRDKPAERTLWTDDFSNLFARLK